MNRTGLRFLVILVVLFVLSGCGITKQQTQNVLILTPEHFKNTATVEDDELEVTAIISTKKRSKRRQGLLHFVYEDNFLRAFTARLTMKPRMAWKLPMPSCSRLQLHTALIARAIRIQSALTMSRSVSLLIEKSWTQSQVRMSRTRVLSGISNLFPDLAKTFMTGFWSQRSLASCRPLIRTRKLREYDFKPLANHLNY